MAETGLSGLGRCLSSLFINNFSLLPIQSLIPCLPYSQAMPGSASIVKINPVISNFPHKPRFSCDPCWSPEPSPNIPHFFLVWCTNLVAIFQLRPLNSVRSRMFISRECKASVSASWSRINPVCAAWWWRFRFSWWSVINLRFCSDSAKLIIPDSCFCVWFLFVASSWWCQTITYEQMPICNMGSEFISSRLGLSLL